MININQQPVDPGALTYEAFVDRLRYNEVHFSERDQRNRALGAFATATLTALEANDFLGRCIWDVIDSRPEMTPAHAVKLSERSAMNILREIDPTYPYAYRKPIMWLHGYEAIANSEDLRERFRTTMLTHDVQSNVSERYKILKLLGLAYGDRFDGPPSILDIGTSALHGVIKLAFEGTEKAPDLRFGDMRIVDAMSVSEIKQMRSGELQPQQNQALTALGNCALRQTVQYGNIRGLDLADIDDPAVRSWIKNCSFYPDEERNPENVREYDLLETLDPHHERIQFSQLDIGSSVGINKLRKELKNRYDIIFFSTVLYQTATRHDQIKMITNAAYMLSERGVIVIQDAVNGNFESPFEYTATVKDFEHPTTQDQEIMRWKTPRCVEGMFSSGTLAIDGEVLTLPEALSKRVTATS